VWTFAKSATNSFIIFIIFIKFLKGRAGIRDFRGIDDSIVVRIKCIYKWSNG
jgi:hypothetical protein